MRTQTRYDHLFERHFLPVQADGLVWDELAHSFDEQPWLVKYE